MYKRQQSDEFALAAGECFEALKAMQKAVKIKYITGPLIGEQVLYSRLDKVSFLLIVEKQFCPNNATEDPKAPS